jgi:hypothetical protein
MTAVDTIQYLRDKDQVSINDRRGCCEIQYVKYGADLKDSFVDKDLDLRHE